jgi:hypothetical protein
MEPTVTVQLARIQTDPNASASPIATAFFSKTTTIDGQTFEAPWTSVSWPLAETGKSVIVDGITLTYAQVSQAVVAVAYAEKALADAPPPVDPPADPVA